MKCPKCGYEFTLRYTRDWWREHAGHYIYCAKQIKGVDDIWDTMLVIVQTVVQD